ncbi:CdaR family transcriptional regulator [Rhodococcus sp. ARC_M6]|uniref:PucR family transcriptional regulator n=1 Tax=Rhodococcus sp. ARC_M6 TaxID=2928852 RepID=UPI001FB56462|nr:helix-turn-helix domain-containing protein [Rhodococcus sp. ARC_M6]MCJ0905683.1 helix-turn-helix domain-containing protein [Rhodococcus sp. ARC_M6]
MLELITQLSGLDTSAEAAVRIIAAFDTLIEARVPAGALTRATAALAQCTAGIHRPDHSVIRFTSDGRQLDGVHATSSLTASWFDGHSVWLERSGPPHPLDGLVLERFAMAARILLTPPNRLAPTDLADPALIELLISKSPSPEDRARAISLLGLDPSRPVRMVAVSTVDQQNPGEAAKTLVGYGLPTAKLVRVATIGTVAAVVLQPRSNISAIPSNLRGNLHVSPLNWKSGKGAASGIVAGVGSAVLPHQAPQSWMQGKLALKFSVARTESAVIDHDDLGALALLADIPSQRLLANADVAALAEFATTEHGRQDLAALAALCKTGSLRQAAVLLHMHHSTIATRIARTEQKVGWDLGSSGGVLRANIALQALHFVHSPMDEPNDSPGSH